MDSAKTEIIPGVGRPALLDLKHLLCRSLEFCRREKSSKQRLYHRNLGRAGTRQGLLAERNQTEEH